MRRDAEAARRARRYHVARHPQLVGLEHIDAAPEGPATWTLRLYFVATRHGAKAAVPAGLTAANISIEPLHGPDLRILGLEKPGTGDPVVLVHVGLENAEHTAVAAGWRYRLRLEHVADVDAKFDAVDFHLTPPAADVPTAPARVRPVPAELAGARASYLAKDYESFRTLMLDRLAVVAPDWRERNASDIGVMLVEVLAYAADMLSYRQDAVATEAYLGTAREPISLRRHARLLDYVPIEGANAAVWVQVWASGAGSIPRGTALLPDIGFAGVCVPDGSPAYASALSTGVPVFETLHDLHALPAKNQYRLYTWGSPHYVLPRGATSATLWDTDLRDLLAPLVLRTPGSTGRSSLAPGDVLILEEVRSPITGRIEDADITRRHAVRLTRVTAAEDRLGAGMTGGNDGPARLIEIEWHPTDALPFALSVSGVAEGRPYHDGARVLGNIVLADHGRSVPAVGRISGRGEAARLALPEPGLTRTIAYDDASARALPAAAMMRRDPALSLPAVSLVDSRGQTWTVRRDLLGSAPFSRDFVVESDFEDRATLRFGDGRLGRAPADAERFNALYRLGYGTAGNIGPNTLTHIVTTNARSFDRYNEWISRVTNPLPAQGGVAAELAAEVRRNAPHAFHRQKRCIIAGDYEHLAGRAHEVARATAVLRWTGSWTTAFVYVQRQEGLPEDPAFRRRVAAYLERYRPAGTDIDVRPPDYVPLDIVLEVTLRPDAFANATEQRLLTRFGTSAADPDGFFAPGRFTFGQTLYLSRVVAAAMAVPGVQDVRPIRFARLADPAAVTTPVSDEIRVGETEIVRADNDPAAAELGRIRFRLEGGR